MRSLALGMLLAASASCGRSNAGSGTVIGAIHGQPFTAVDAIAGNRISIPDTYAEIVVADRAGICAAASGPWAAKGSHYLRFFLADVDMSNQSSRKAPVSPGVYTANTSAGGAYSAHIAIVEARTSDENCVTVLAQSSLHSTGTVTLTRVDNGSYAGTFDLTMDSGDRFTGSFDAPDCPAIAGTSDGGGCGLQGLEGPYSVPR